MNFDTFHSNADNSSQVGMKTDVVYSAPNGVHIISDNGDKQPKYMVYTERWIILLTITTITFSNMTQWCAYSALVNQTNMFYCGPEDWQKCNASFLSNQIFQIVAMLVALAGMYCATHFGILPTLRISAFCNIIGSFIRLAASIPIISSFTLRKTLMLFGTLISAIAQMYFVIFSKVAESWFAPENRATANVACSNSMVFGVVIGTLLPSLIIKNEASSDITTSWGFFLLNSIICVMCTVPLFFSFVAQNSLPKSPPSASSEHESNIPISSGLKKCLKNTRFLVQSIIYSLNFATINGIIFTSDILNYQGYNLKGYPITIATIMCILFAYIIGIIADRTRKFKEITIANTCTLSLVCIAIRLYLLKQYSGWYDSFVICTLLGIAMSCSAAQIPIGNEMGVETTFPIHESVSTGLLNIFGQAWIFSFYFILYALMETDYFYKSEPGKNWQVSLDFWVFTSLINAIFAIFFLNPRYNRMQMENKGC